MAWWNMAATQGLYGLLSELVETSPQAEAAIDCSFSLHCTYYQLKDRVDQTAAAWQKLGVEKGSRVLWLGQNSSRVLEGILACARLGAIFCPVNWRQSEAELSFVLQDIEPALVIWQEQEIGERLRALRDQNQGSDQYWLQHDGTDSPYEALLNSAEAELLPETNDDATIDDTVLMLYTAAFAGQPNGALLSHRALMAQSRVFAGLRELDGSYRYLNVGPLFHVATLLETMATFCIGGCNVFIRRADAEDICQAVEQHQCNGAFVLPPIIDSIIEYTADHTINLKSLCVLPGRTEWNELITVDESAWGKFPYGFGQTETFGYASYWMLAPEGVGSMGKASPAVEIAMLDDAGSVLPKGEVGEIAVRGDTVMNEYWRRPELNAQRRSGDWHRCNDLGRLEQDGSISFIGSKQRLIRSAQENIYPAEVENCLKGHPAIAEVGVIGVPDPKWDQSVKAIVVLKEGSDCSEKDIIEFCKDKIASYKKPKAVEFAASLPKAAYALDYDALDEQYGGGGYPGFD